MQVNVQDRSVLYKTPEPVVVPEGIYPAVLVGVRCFANAFGQRVGLVFEITSGPHKGAELMEAAALNPSPRGKLADLLRGIGGAAGDLATARELVGRRCQIVVRNETSKAGKTYAAIIQTMRR